MPNRRNDCSFDEVLFLVSLFGAYQVYSKKGSRAMRIMLDNPPFESKDQSLKTSASDLVMSALSYIRDSEIQSEVDSLSQDQADVLLKYVYRGFESSGKNCGSLLKWHEAITKVHGLGSIVRAMSARKVV